MSSKLFTTRQGTVLLGVIAAAIAAIALLVYLNHYRNNVKAGNGAISVLVAQKMIESGTLGDVIRINPSFYQATNIAKSEVESAAIFSPVNLKGDGAQQDILPGSPHTAPNFWTLPN